MFIAMNRFQVVPGRGEDFERVWRERETYLDGVPADPYSDLGFVYKRGETSERRATYTLYSVGDDNQDNAGARARSEYDALRVEGKGTDMVFMPVTK